VALTYPERRSFHTAAVPTAAAELTMNQMSSTGAALNDQAETVLLRTTVPIAGTFMRYLLR